MAQRIRDIMTTDPVTVPAHTSVTEVARLMRDENIGAVLVVDGDRLCGLVTDRDLVVRVLAEGEYGGETTMHGTCSGSLVTVSPDDDVATAEELMRTRAVRRLPVVENGRPVGIVALGDLAVERDEGAALSGISAAGPNH
ncbi:CBS domain-containing protein [Streptomyces sp. NPDC059506]|uniref:CBS domain-containing protein n=1 Tax=unclassified Streptomyces TaxID=2593676 RepID=UPI000CC9F7BB|nr:CBS domain-containing protein [Streptomyces sp. SCUT-3]PLW65820.1 CBS domain-containing protein [Streptomyces sp. DJ]QMV24324.1 CBS domain-containing protein [Streptomyces sp. SCUT-3]